MRGGAHGAAIATGPVLSAAARGPRRGAQQLQQCFFSAAARWLLSPLISRPPSGGVEAAGRGQSLGVS